MRNNLRRILVLAMIFLLAFEGLVLAAGARLTNVRFHSGHDHDRIVFDLNKRTEYKVSEDPLDGSVIIDFLDTSASGLVREDFRSSRVEKVKYGLKQDHVLVTLDLKEGMAYEVKELKNPYRIFIDIKPGKKGTQQAQGRTGRTNRVQLAKNNGKVVEELAPGLTKTRYTYFDDDGQVTAYFVEADKNRYTVKPALANGKVPGRETVSGISDRYQALAAVNASYFALNGDLIGITRIDNVIAGTTYYTRSAFGLTTSGKPVFGEISYTGKITLDVVTQPIGGVDCERGEDMVVIYNSAYGDRTRTNEFGKEYVVQDGKVTKVVKGGNAAIPLNGYVVSVHGAAEAAFEGVRKGDKAVLEENLGAEWDGCSQILGVGPRLLENGMVNVTAAKEEFPDDIRYGRAPRSAVGVTKNGNFLLGVVDGRQDSSHGLTLTEWAGLLKEMGAVDAINFDGGGSSELVVGGEIQNSPSDGKERPVGTALLVMNK